MIISKICEGIAVGLYSHYGRLLDAGLHHITMMPSPEKDFDDLEGEMISYLYHPSSGWKFDKIESNLFYRSIDDNSYWQGQQWIKKFRDYEQKMEEKRMTKIDYVYNKIKSYDR